MGMFATTTVMKMYISLVSATFKARNIDLPPLSQTTYFLFFPLTGHSLLQQLLKEYKHIKDLLNVPLICPFGYVFTLLIIYAL